MDAGIKAGQTRTVPLMTAHTAWEALWGRQDAGIKVEQTREKPLMTVQTALEAPWGSQEAGQTEEQCCGLRAPGALEALGGEIGTDSKTGQARTAPAVTAQSFFETR